MTVIAFELKGVTELSLHFRINWGMNENLCRAVVKFMPVWSPSPETDASVLIADPYHDMPELDDVSDCDSDEEVPDLISDEVFLRRSIDQISLFSIDDGYPFRLHMAMDGNFRLRRPVTFDSSTLPSADLQRGEVYANEGFQLLKCGSDSTVWHSVFTSYDSACQHRCRCPDNHGEKTELAWGKLKVRAKL
ncbi:hypothetical protein DFH06DRAFT_1344895 [Mycena polygramma]|nr:hypothetical protein DFH06DRAFT_1344895 [Mycena polygramma]